MSAGAFVAGSIITKVVMDTKPTVSGMEDLKKSAKDMKAAVENAGQGIDAAMKKTAADVKGSSAGWKNAVASAANVMADEMDKAANKSGNSWKDTLKGIKGEFGKSSVMGQTLKLAMGGGAVAGIAMAAHAYQELTAGMLQFSKECQNADNNWADLTGKFIEAVPIIGTIYSASENLAEMMTGTKASIEAQNEEIRAMDAATKAAAESARVYRDILKDYGVQARKSAIEIAALRAEQGGNPEKAAQIRLDAANTDEVTKVGDTNAAKLKEFDDKWIEERKAANERITKLVPDEMPWGQWAISTGGAVDDFKKTAEEKAEVDRQTLRGNLALREKQYYAQRTKIIKDGEKALEDARQKSAVKKVVDDSANVAALDFLKRQKTAGLSSDEIKLQSVRQTASPDQYKWLRGIVNETHAMEAHADAQKKIIELAQEYDDITAGTSQYDKDAMAQMNAGKNPEDAVGIAEWNQKNTDAKKQVEISKATRELADEARQAGMDNLTKKYDDIAHNPDLDSVQQWTRMNLVGKMNEALKGKELEARAKALKEAIETPAEKLGKQADDYKKMLDAGLITDDDYQRGLKMLNGDVGAAKLPGLLIAGSADAYRAKYANSSTRDDIGKQTVDQLKTANDTLTTMAGDLKSLQAPEETDLDGLA